jgi:hypothetical protein
MERAALSLLLTPDSPTYIGLKLTIRAQSSVTVLTRFRGRATLK